MALLVAAVSCQKKETAHNLNISGEVKGLKKGTLYIQKLQDTTLVAIDTIQIDGDAHFTAGIDIDSPQMLYLFLDRGVTNSLDNNLPFFAEPGNMTINTELGHFLSSAKITGSKNQEQYEQFKKIKSRFTDRNLELMEFKLQSFRYGQKRIIDSLEQLQAVAVKRHYLHTLNFAINHKDLEIAPYLALAEIPDVNLIYLDTIRKSMSPKVAQSFYGKKLEELYKARKTAESK